MARPNWHTKVRVKREVTFLRVHVLQHFKCNTFVFYRPPINELDPKERIDGLLLFQNMRTGAGCCPFVGASLIGNTDCSLVRSMAGTAPSTRSLPISLIAVHRRKSFGPQFAVPAKATPLGRCVLKRSHSTAFTPAKHRNVLPLTSSVNTSLGSPVDSFSLGQTIDE